MNFPQSYTFFTYPALGFWNISWQNDLPTYEDFIAWNSTFEFAAVSKV